MVELVCVPQEINSISQDAQALKIAQNRFASSKSAVMALRPEDEGMGVNPQKCWTSGRKLCLYRVCAGAEMLVPLTGSLFVPGRLASTAEVLVDVGTGYYISKSVDGAKDFLEKKVRGDACDSAPVPLRVTRCRRAAGRVCQEQPGCVDEGDRWQA